MKYTYTFVTPGYHELQLLEDSLLAITISILHRVESVHQGRLASGSGVVTSLAQGVGSSGSGVITSLPQGVGASLADGVGASRSQDPGVTSSAGRSSSTGASLLLVRG